MSIQTKVSERVAIAEAMTARLHGRHGGNHNPDQAGNISSLDNGDTRDIAAAKAGLGSGKTLEAAQRAISNGHQSSKEENHHTPSN